MTAVAAAAALAIAVTAAGHTGCNTESSGATSPVPSSDASTGETASDAEPDTTDASDDSRDAQDTGLDAAEADGGNWATDPNGWVPLDENLEWLAPCSLTKANLSIKAIPALQWLPCGAGCAVADILEGLSNPEVTGASHGDTLAGTPYAMVHAYLSGPSASFAVGRLLNLDTGATLAAFRLQIAKDQSTPLCGAGIKSHSPLGFWFGHTSNGGSVLLFDPAKSIWTMMSPPSQQLAGFTSVLDGIGGVACTPLGSGLYVTTSLAPPAFSEVFASKILTIPARGDQVFFPESSSGPETYGKLLSWTPDAGAQVLLEPMNDPMITGLSDTRLVWLAVPDQDDFSVSPTNVATWYWSPRTTNAAGLEVHQGPSVPNSPPYISWFLKTEGDYAAVVSWTRQQGKLPPQLHEEWRTAVLQLSSGKLWMLKAAGSDHTPDEVWAITDKYLYVGEGPAGSSRSTEVARYDLDQLDSLAAQ